MKMAIVQRHAKPPLRTVQKQQRRSTFASMVPHWLVLLEVIQGARISPTRGSHRSEGAAPLLLLDCIIFFGAGSSLISKLNYPSTQVLLEAPYVMKT